MVTANTPALRQRAKRIKAQRERPIKVAEPVMTPATEKAQISFARGAAFIAAQVRLLSARPGVYRMLNAKGQVLYVGKAKNLPKRVLSYTQQNRLPLRLQRMVSQTVALEIVETGTEAEALLLEANLIKQYVPPYNVVLKDDKSFPYLLLSKGHNYPALWKHRGARDVLGEYFGPFASVDAVNETLEILQRGFMLRSCEDHVFAARKRPCLQYHIKRCSAPCVGKVSAPDYAESVREAKDFLHGRSSELQQELATAMEAASAAMEFERAAKLRDRIRALTRVQSRQHINVAGIGDADIFGVHQEAGRLAVQVFFFRHDRNYGARCYFPQHGAEETTESVLAAFMAQFYAGHPPPPLLLCSHAPADAEWLASALASRAGYKVVLIVPQQGDKKRLTDLAVSNASSALARKLADTQSTRELLAGVAQVFGLKATPQRIEIYDNSHLQGTHAVGVMVVAGPEGFEKKKYRKFNFATGPQLGGDDFAMMQEMLQRRFKRLQEADEKFNVLPDLLIIDGGPGQVSKVQAALAALNLTEIAVVGMAKGPDRNAGREVFYRLGQAPLQLPPQHPVLYYLQRLRDEAHRFAIGTHRAKRTKAIGETGLEDVPGIGATRKKALLNHFGSAKAVRAAGVADLARVPGISQALAENIFAFFRG